MLDYRSVPSWKPLLLGVCFMLCPFSGGDDKICFFSIIQGSEVTISTCKMHLAASRFSDASFLMESFRLCFFSRSVHLLFFEGFWRWSKMIKSSQHMRVGMFFFVRKLWWLRCYIKKCCSAKNCEQTNDWKHYVHTNWPIPCLFRFTNDWFTIEWQYV